jgi:hypothetical protein
MAGSCSSKTPTPTRCCRKPSGGATDHPHAGTGVGVVAHHALGARRLRWRVTWRVTWRGKVLVTDLGSGLAAALASLGRAFMARDS